MNDVFIYQMMNMAYNPFKLMLARFTTDKGVRPIIVTPIANMEVVQDVIELVQGLWKNKEW